MPWALTAKISTPTACRGKKEDSDLVAGVYSLGMGAIETCNPIRRQINTKRCKGKVLL